MARGMTAIFVHGIESSKKCRYHDCCVALSILQRTDQAAQMEGIEIVFLAAQTPD